MEAILVHDEATAKAFDEIMTILGNTRMDLNHHEAIMEGSWPQAVEILTRALAHAEEKQRAGFNIL